MIDGFFSEDARDGAVGFYFDEGSAKISANFGDERLVQHRFAASDDEVTDLGFLDLFEYFFDWPIGVCLESFFPGVRRVTPGTRKITFSCTNKKRWCSSV